jgi:hypothetical protein
MRSNERVNGWDFQWNPSDSKNNIGYYDCRGEVMYDDYHDQTPEPKLWEAAMKLEDNLMKEGFLAEANHSEKGWVEVTIIKANNEG